MDLLAVDIHNKIFITFVNKWYMFRSCWPFSGIKVRDFKA